MACLGDEPQFLGVSTAGYVYAASHCALHNGCTNMQNEHVLLMVTSVAVAPITAMNVCIIGILYFSIAIAFTAIIIAITRRTQAASFGAHVCRQTLQTYLMVVALPCSTLLLSMRIRRLWYLRSNEYVGLGRLHLPKSREGRKTKILGPCSLLKVFLSGGQPY